MKKNTETYKGSVKLVNPFYGPERPTLRGDRRNDENIAKIKEIVSIFARPPKGAHDGPHIDAVIALSKLYRPYVSLLTSIKRNTAIGGYDYEFLSSSKYTPEKVQEQLGNFLQSAGFQFLVEILNVHSQEYRGTIKSSPFVWDEILRAKPYQLDLFNEWEQDYLRDVAQANGHFDEERNLIEYINRKGESLNFKKGELKMLLCFSKLLHDKSLNKSHPDKENYYAGDVGVTREEKDYRLENVGKIPSYAPQFTTTITEIAKEYFSKEEPAGSEIKEIRRLLNDLAYNEDKRVLMRHEKEVNGQKYNFVRFQHLIEITHLVKGEIIDIQSIETSSKYIITLHPFFIEEITKRWIEFPSNILSLLSTVNNSEPTMKLLYYLSRDYTNKHGRPKTDSGYRTEAGLERNSKGEPGLLWVVSGGDMKQKQRKRAKEGLIKAAENMKEIGLLNDFRIEKGKIGEKMVFEVSNAWISNRKTT